MDETPDDDDDCGDGTAPRIKMDGLDIIVLDADVEPAVMAVEADFNEDRDGGGGHGRLRCGRPRSCVK